MASPILIAEDNTGDEVLVRRVLEAARIRNPVHMVGDGEETISYLAGTGKYRNRLQYPLPAILLLDLKMPGVNGFDVLRWLQTHPIPTAAVVLSAVSDLKDIRQAYALGANSFLIKPLTLEEITNLMSGLKGIVMKPDGDGFSLEYEAPASYLRAETKSFLS